MAKAKRSVKRLRNFRVYHRILGIGLCILLFISAITGFFLGWKKNVDLLQPPTQKGATTELMDWLPLDTLAVIAQAEFQSTFPEMGANPIDRMDVRPQKGIVKVIFEKGWWEIQLDGSTGAVLSFAKRHSDWIEQIHDGSIISDAFKLGSMNLLGLGLLILIITGTWLYYGPKVIRKKRLRQKR